MKVVGSWGSVADISFSVDYTVCDLCGDCIELCPSACLVIQGDKIIFDGGDCQFCEVCKDICEHEAICIGRNDL